LRPNFVAGDIIRHKKIGIIQIFIKYDDRSECTVLRDFVGGHDYEVMALVHENWWEKLNDDEIDLMRLFYDF